MPVRIPLTALAKTVRLYGQSTAPAPLSGTFACHIGGTDFVQLPFVEGLVNKRGVPQRLLSVTCSLANWDLDRALQTQVDSVLHLVRDSGPVLFALERVTVEIEAHGPLDALPPRLRGHARVVGGDRSLLEVYEPSVFGGRRLYLKGRPETLQRLAQQIAKQGSGELLLEEPRTQ